MKKVSTLFIRNAYKPECLQCAHFSPPHIIHPSPPATLSPHMLYERGVCGKVSDKNVVSGEIRPVLAKYARGDDELCGLDGRFFIHRNPEKAKWAISAGNITPLKNNIRCEDSSSTKLPVTDLTTAPFQGAGLNLHWYKAPERVLRPMDEALNEALNNFLYTDKQKTK